MLKKRVATSTVQNSVHVSTFCDFGTSKEKFSLKGHKSLDRALRNAPVKKKAVLKVLKGNYKIPNSFNAPSLPCDPYIYNVMIIYRVLPVPPQLGSYKLQQNSDKRMDFWLETSKKVFDADVMNRKWSRSLKGMFNKTLIRAAIKSNEFLYLFIYFYRAHKAAVPHGRTNYTHLSSKAGLTKDSAPAHVLIGEQQFNSKSVNLLVSSSPNVFFIPWE